MSWSNLPEDLWKLILVHIPLPERLGTCSRVSKKLCRAAAAATEQLDILWLRDHERVQRLVQWLHHKGQHVTSLDLETLGCDLTELPCQQLCQLVVSDCRVQLGPSSSHPGVLHSCSGLTKLRLSDCEVSGGPNSLTALSAVPALQRLELSNLYCSDTYGQLHLPGSTLQVLTQLTYFNLDRSVKVTAESLQHISALQHLQVLHLTSPSLALSPSSTQGLAQLTALQTLKLSNSTEHPLDAAVLQHFTGLRQLNLFWGVLPGAGSSAVLLSVIGQQQQLQQLALWGVQCEWPTGLAAYTALTASSSLQKLILRLGGLPAGIWQAVLRPQQQLSHLQILTLGRWDAEDNEVIGQDPLPSSMASTDISRVVACCPALQCLDIDLQPDVQLAALSQLTALTRLVAHEATESSVKSLSSLSGLQQLFLYVEHPFSPSALLSLTALRQLTRLVACRPLAALDDANGVRLDIESQAGDSTPDVWLQLLEHCASVSSCQPAVVRGLGLQLVELQQQVGSLQQQLQQQVGSLQQQMQQAAELREQEMVELRKQVSQLTQALQHRG